MIIYARIYIYHYYYFTSRQQQRVQYVFSGPQNIHHCDFVFFCFFCRRE